MPEGSGCVNPGVFTGNHSSCCGVYSSRSCNFPAKWNLPGLQGSEEKRRVTSYDDSKWQFFRSAMG